MGADRIFLEIAKKDLLSARLLYSEELYPQAIFYLQQSIEKAMKSFTVLMGIMEEGEARKQIGHNPLKLQRKLLNELKEGFETLPTLKKISLFETGDADKVYRDTLELQKLLDRLIEERPIYLSRQEIMQFIESSNRFESDMKELNDRLASARYEDFYEAFDEAGKILPGIIEEILPDTMDIETIEKETNDAVLGLTESTKKIRLVMVIILKILYVYLSIFYLSIITFPHAIVSRYPDENFNPLAFYNRELPLIQLFDECSITTNKVLTELEKLAYIIDRELI
jgi:hypothetical protein